MQLENIRRAIVEWFDRGIAMPVLGLKEDPIKQISPSAYRVNDRALIADLLARPDVNLVILKTSLERDDLSVLKEFNRYRGIDAHFGGNSEEVRDAFVERLSSTGFHYTDLIHKLSAEISANLATVNNLSGALRGGAALQTRSDLPGTTTYFVDAPDRVETLIHCSANYMGNGFVWMPDVFVDREILKKIEARRTEISEAVSNKSLSTEEREQLLLEWSELGDRQDFITEPRGAREIRQGEIAFYKTGLECGLVHTGIIGSQGKKQLVHWAVPDLPMH